MILCDHCGLCYHYQCANLEHIPVDNFYCFPCTEIITRMNALNDDQLDPYENRRLRSFLERPEVLGTMDPEIAT